MRPHGENWVPLCKRDSISTLWIVAICANQLTMNFIWVPIGALTNPYCQKLGLNNVATTLVQLIGSIVGILVPPFAAVWSDTTTMKFGRRRIYMICGEFLVLVGLMMVAFCRELSPKSHSGAIAVFVIGQILASVGGNSANGPGRSMCSDLVPPSQQVLVSNICTLYAGLSGVISNLIGALKLYQYTSMNNETLVLMVSCIIGFVSLVISVVVSPEEPLTEKPETVNPLRLIGQSFKFLTRDLGYICAAFLFFQLGVAMYSWNHTNYMGKVVFKGDASSNDGVYDSGVSHAQLLMLIQTIVQVVFSFLNTAVVNRIGLKNTWIFGMCCGIVCDLLFFFILDKWAYIISYITQGIVQVIANSTPYAMVTLITPSDKLAGIITIVIFFGNIAGVIAQFGLQMGLGSVAWFSANPGRLIGVSLVFLIVALVFGYLGFNVSGKNVENDFSESTDSSEDKPAAL
ncbi:major facilitator superfamily transporter [Tritrichomonas foetus]|uniref:Major facilitator superfamily transporter n=1 Tax=Tritrichomonas foetus TaxID=1144522 RepID=A0A1J4KP79_9EUKA|nr:major facilitator superfamily transporter [Tritrichomonas foetus]|eukprot:OHT11604.1 major facilitator superfamily transporter [Tritrichomonas foetus]